MLKVPRITDRQRVAFDGFRERQKARSQQARPKILDLNSEEVPLEGDVEDSLLERVVSAGPPPADDEEARRKEAIGEEILVDEDDEEGYDVDLDNDDFQATDDYLDSLS